MQLPPGESTSQQPGPETIGAEASWAEGGLQPHQEDSLRPPQEDQEHRGAEPQKVAQERPLHTQASDVKLANSPVVLY